MIATFWLDHKQKNPEKKAIAEVYCDLQAQLKLDYRFM
jgi:hypothetical protein